MYLNPLISLIRDMGRRITAAMGTPTAALYYQLVKNSISVTPTYFNTFLKRVVTIKQHYQFS